MIFLTGAFLSGGYGILKLRVSHSSALATFIGSRKTVSTLLVLFAALLASFVLLQWETFVASNTARIIFLFL